MKSESALSSQLQVDSEGNRVIDDFSEGSEEEEEVPEDYSGYVMSRDGNSTVRSHQSSNHSHRST